MTVEKVAPVKKKETEPEEYYFEYGSVTGMLEGLNLHNGKNIFYLYVFTGQKVKCKFPPELFETVQQALRKRVEVHGKLTSIKSKPFPIRVEVRDIEIYPPDSELPSFMELKGIANGSLGDKTIEEYIWEMRHEGE
jgi:hypothetical protein